MMIRKWGIGKGGENGTQWGNDPKGDRTGKRQGTCECTKHSGKISAEESRWGRSDRAYPLPVKRLFFSWKRNHKGSKCLSSVWLQPGQKVQRALPDARNRRRRSRVGNGWWGFAGKKNDGQSDLLQRNRAIHRGDTKRTLHRKLCKRRFGL